MIAALLLVVVGALLLGSRLPWGARVPVAWTAGLLAGGSALAGSALGALSPQGSALAAAGAGAAAVAFLAGRRSGAAVVIAASLLAGSALDAVASSGPWVSPLGTASALIAFASLWTAGAAVGLGARLLDGSEGRAWAMAIPALLLALHGGQGDLRLEIAAEGGGPVVEQVTVADPQAPELSAVATPVRTPIPGTGAARGALALVALAGAALVSRGHRRAGVAAGVVLVVALAAVSRAALAMLRPLPMRGADLLGPDWDSRAGFLHPAVDAVQVAPDQLGPIVAALLVVIGIAWSTVFPAAPAGDVPHGAGLASNGEPRSAAAEAPCSSDSCALPAPAPVLPALLAGSASLVLSAAGAVTGVEAAFPLVLHSSVLLVAAAFWLGASSMCAECARVGVGATLLTGILAALLRLA